MDFTLKKYKTLLTTLQSAGYAFYTFEHYLSVREHAEKFVILRHDVDLLPKNSLDTARIEASLDIKGSYYFRVVPQSWDEDIIREIAALGHEVGYHYESLTTCNGDIGKAYEDFT
ncbi:MAG: hypothetical protein WBH80_02355, partial [Bacteroidales bacterium]